MSEFVIYGYSDDIIVVEGDVSEQFYAKFGEPTYLMIVPSQVIIEVVYGNQGVWSLKALGEHYHVERYDVGEHDYCDYSQMVKVTPDWDRTTVKVVENVSQCSYEECEDAIVDAEYCCLEHEVYDDEQ